MSAFALLTGVISTSCLDQLEEETYGKYSADTYFDTTAKMEMAVNGIYETFSSITTYGQYWQVYGDEQDAQRRFKSYRKCSEVYIRLWNLGRSVQQLTVAA